MAADLSGIIAPFPGASFSDEYPGTQLIDLDNGNFTHSLPDGCVGCSRAGNEHKCWKNLKLGPASAAKLWMDELDDHAEAARDKVDIERALIYFMNLQAHGVLDVVTPTIQGLQPSATKSWPYVSCTAGQVRCTYASGTYDPRSIDVMVPTLNEDWGTGGGGSQYENETYGIGLRPTGIVSFSAPSAAAETKEYIAYKIRPATGGWDVFALDDDFIIYIFGSPDSSLVETIFPVDDPGSISVQLQHYHPVTEEPWATYRHSYSWPVERASKTFALVDDSIHVIEAVKAVPFWISGWFTAVHTVLGVPADVTAIVVAACDIVRESGQWKTIMDLTPHAATFDGTGELVITYYRDSAADHAVHCGVNKRCANHITDPTGTWGEYCNYRADRGNGEVASEGANFVSTGCLLTQCSKWTPATPTSPVNQAVHKQIINDFPWTMQQALVGFQQNELIRSGTPSLASLAGQNMATPTGYHAQRLADAFEHAGWGKAYQSGVAALWGKMPGFEVDTFGTASQLPDFRDEATWPDYGPGGNNWARNAELPPEDATNLANTDSDPHRVQRSQIMKRSVSMLPYRGVESRSGTLGKYIETSPNSLYQLFLPRIRASNRVDIQNFTDGSITPGYWNADLEETTEELAVYFWRVLFVRGRRYDRTVGNYNDFGGAVRTVTVKEAVEVEGGYVLYLANGTEQASSFITAQTERETQWKQGGTNVDPPELARTYNWQSSGRRGMDNSKVRQGMVIRATVANGFSAPLAISGDDRTERRAWIARAIAHYDAEHVEDWDTGVSQETRRNLQMGRVFFAFDTPGEVIETLTIKRDSVVEDDQLITLAFYSGGNTKPVEINKDVYWWEPWADETIGLRGIFVYFSVLNGTADPLDYNVTIYVETDVQEYPPQTVDLLGDALNGWDINIPVTFSFDRDVLAVPSVLVEKRDGSIQEVTSIGIIEPATWSGYPIDKFFIEISGGNVTIKVSPEHSMDTLKVIVTLDEYTDGNYYDDFVEFHGTFNGYASGGANPAGHRHFANRMDGLLIMDDGGLWKQWTDDNGGLGAWANRVLDVRDDGFAHWLELTLAKSHYNSEDADDEISGDDVKLLPANGEAFLKSILEDDDCLVLSGRIADRNAHARNEEAYSPVKALERMMG